MNDTRFNKAIGDIHNISMTSAEKQMVFRRVMSAKTVGGDLASEYDFTYDRKEYRTPVESPWGVLSCGRWIQRHRWVSVVTVLIIVIVASKSAVLASYTSLPGEILYSIKIRMVEPIRIAFAPSALAKAKIQAELLETRFQEIQTLAARGMLTPFQEEKVNTWIKKQSVALAVNIALAKQTAPEEAQTITTSIEAGMHTHERILAVLASHQGPSRPKEVEGKKDDTKKPDQVSMSQPSPVSSPGISSAITSSVAVNKAVTNSVHPEYEQKKTAIVSLLASTTIQFAAVSAQSSQTGTSSQIQKAILQEGQIAIDHAKQYMRDADIFDQNSQIEQSYAALRNAERSLEEVSLLLKADKRFETDMKKIGN